MLKAPPGEREPNAENELVCRQIPPGKRKPETEQESVCIKTPKGRRGPDAKQEFNASRPRIGRLGHQGGAGPRDIQGCPQPCGNYKNKALGSAP